MARQSNFVGHPSEPEAFEFSQWTGDITTGRAVTIRSFVVVNTAWPRWRRLLARAGVMLLRRAQPPTTGGTE